MSLRVLAQMTGLLGGVAWAGRWAAGLAGDNDPSWGDAAHWAGLALLGVATGTVGAGLVSRGTVWLRWIVGVAVPLLVWSVYAVIKGDGAGIALDGVIGLLGIAFAAVHHSRTRAPVGAHAASR